MGPGRRARWGTLGKPEDEQGRIRCAIAVTCGICVSGLGPARAVPGALLVFSLRHRGPSRSEAGAAVSLFARERR